MAGVHDEIAAIRVGVDLANIDDVEASVARFGRRYIDRLYTERELTDSDGAPRARAASLAARFAAKEATIKVLQASADAPSWTDIEVHRDDAGACHLHLSGAAAALAQELGLRHWALSLTHEAQMAAAVVVASGPTGTSDVDQPRQPTLTNQPTLIHQTDY